MLKIFKLDANILLFVFFGVFWLHHTACGILVPQLGIEPTPPVLEVQSLNHWTAREVPMPTFSMGKLINNSGFLDSLDQISQRTIF